MFPRLTPIAAIVCAASCISFAEAREKRSCAEFLALPGVAKQVRRIAAFHPGANDEADHRASMTMLVSGGSTLAIATGMKMLENMERIPKQGRLTSAMALASGGIMAVGAYLNPADAPKAVGSREEIACIEAEVAHRREQASTAATAHEAVHVGSLSKSLKEASDHADDAAAAGALEPAVIAVIAR